MFALQLWRQTPHALQFQNSNIRGASQWESLYSKTGDKAGTWIKGLKKLCNNFILPDRATFHRTNSIGLRQYLVEILSSCVYIYHTFHFVYQRCKFHPRPHISGHCFQITANFPSKVLAPLRWWGGEDLHTWKKKLNIVLTFLSTCIMLNRCSTKLFQ